MRPRVSRGTLAGDYDRLYGTSIDECFGAVFTLEGRRTYDRGYGTGSGYGAGYGTGWGGGYGAGYGRGVGLYIYVELK